MVAVNPHKLHNPGDGLLLKMQGGGCFHCGKRLDLAKATRDHLTPRHAGASLPFNKVMACVKCNSRKGHTLPTELDKEKARNLYANCGLPRFGVI